MARLITSARAGLAALVLFAMALPAAATDRREHSATFGVYIAGIKAGILAFSGVEEAGRYAAAGKIESTGLIGALVRVRYDAKSHGRISGGGFVPQRYEEVAQTPTRESEAVMAYRAGVPQVKEYNPPRKSTKGGIEPATQAGTVDPMTLIYAALRDVPRDEVCALDVKMFDGARRSQVVLSGAAPQQDGTIACQGEYRRLAGFTAKELAERPRYPFTLTYVPASDGLYRVQRMVTQSDAGRATLVRY
jgi:hypothetical protein